MGSHDPLLLLFASPNDDDVEMLSTLKMRSSRRPNGRSCRISEAWMSSSTQYGPSVNSSITEQLEEEDDVLDDGGVGVGVGLGGEDDGVGWGGADGGCGGDGWVGMGVGIRKS